MHILTKSPAIRTQSIRPRRSEQVIAGVPAADRRIGPEVTIVPRNKIALRAERMRLAVGGVVDEELDHGLRRRVFRPMRKVNFGLEGAKVRHRVGIERWLAGESGPIRDHDAGERCIIERAIAPLRRSACRKRASL